MLHTCRNFNCKLYYLVELLKKQICKNITLVVNFINVIVEEDLYNFIEFSISSVDDTIFLLS